MINEDRKPARLFISRETVLVLIVGFIFVFPLAVTSGAGETCELTNLTVGIGSQVTRESFLPKISADGTRISFESSRDFFNGGTDTTRQIFYIDTIANMIFPVTIGGGGTNRLADISGDGSTIVFTSNKDHEGNNADTNQEIFLFDINMSSFAQITDSTGGAFSSQEIPFANSDGTKIAFSFSRNLGGNSDGNREVYLFDTNTSTLTQVTATPASKDNFVHGISADGTRIVFVSRADFTGNNADGNVEIFMYDSDSNMFTQVTNIVGGSASNFASAFPDISADGGTIVFQSLNDHVNENGDGNVEIFSYDVISGTITQITHTMGVNNIEPSVNADGTRIVFGSNSNITGENGSGFNQVFLYDVPSDMFTQVSMSNTVGGAQFPDIDANGGRIVFQFQSTLPFPPHNEIVIADCVPGGDSDGDGVPDDEDDCVDSDTSESIVIDDCDSGVANTLDVNGCTISDLIAEIATGASNQGNFTSEVSHLINELVAAGIISGSDKGAVQSCAGGANIP